MIRFDTFKVGVKGLEPDSNGFLHITSARPTRAGVFKYKDGDGNTVLELRPESEVFREDSLRTLAMKPFTVEHRGGLLDSDQVQDHSAGSTGENIGRDGDFVTCSIAVHRKDAVERIVNDGILDLSAGYNCDIEETSGVDPKYGRYDRIQRNIEYNHLTSTRKGRGEGCQIRLDHETAILTTEKEENPMKVIEKVLPAVKAGEFRLDADTVQIPEDQENVFGNVTARMDLMAEELGKVNDAKDALQARFDAAEKELAEAKENLESAIPADQIQERVKERSSLLALAGEFKLDSAEDMEDREIKVEIAKAYGKFDEAKMDSDPYLDACMDVIHNNKDHARAVVMAKHNLASATGSNLEGDDKALAEA